MSGEYPIRSVPEGLVADHLSSDVIVGGAGESNSVEQSVRVLEDNAILTPTTGNIKNGVRQSFETASDDETDYGSDDDSDRLERIESIIQELRARRSGLAE